MLPNLILTFTVTPVDAKVSPTSHATADEFCYFSLRLIVHLAMGSVSHDFRVYNTWNTDITMSSQNTQNAAITIILVRL